MPKEESKQNIEEKRNLTLEEIEGAQGGENILDGFERQLLAESFGNEVERQRHLQNFE